MARRPASLLLFILIAVSRVPAFAQDAPSNDPPAHISLVDGAAVLERDGRIDSEPASMPLLAGDRVRTQGGRVEVLFADGSALHLDANTVVDFQSDEVVRLIEGRIRLAIIGPAREVAYRIDAPSAWVQINDPGEYRVGILRDGDVELAVLRGAAELINEQGRSFIRAGERTFAREGSAPSAPYVFNSAAWDAFDRWSEARRDRRLGRSAQYLPDDVRPYSASFDTYGDWRYEQVYGYVWYPRVQVGWRPYHRGRWASLRPYGWTWIAADPWGWPTHHYGRWGISAGSSWFWIPGRHWGPAWVSWAYATDYVSWCPLGWNNRPVLNIVNVNVYGGRRYNPWSAWSVVPRRHFNAGYVNVRSVASIRIDQRIHNTFVVRDAAPETRYAVGRSPIRSAGRYAVPRGSAPGAYASDTGGVGARLGGTRSDGGGERRFPAPARAPRTPSVSPSSAGESAAPATRAPGGRAVARERAPSDQRPDQGVGTSPGTAGGSRGLESPQYRRAPDARRPTGNTNTEVTPGPAGAVRSVPRVREPSTVSPGELRGSASGDRTRMREERAPVYSAPPSAPAGPRSSSEDPGASRASPGSRRAPDAGTEYRRRSVPRTDPAPSAPSYRSAPEQRRAPSGPPDAAPSYRSAPEQRRAPSGPPPDAAPSYRSAPEQRRAPSGPPPGAAPSYRSAPEQRRAPSGPPPGSAPSYRSAPEQRRAPSGPPPGAGPSGESRPSGDRGSAAGSRERSGEGRPSGGQAVRRRR